jgi:molybdopterin-guanine dinucleotide biosynthesis protein A
MSGWNPSQAAKAITAPAERGLAGMIAVAPLKGLVLAGGSSERMGIDKAAMELDGISLLDRAVQLLRAELDDVRVSVRTDQLLEPVRSRYPTIVDQLQNSGPAAGILAAHLSAPQAAWLVVACDMPLLNAVTLRLLLAERDPARDATALCTSPLADPEPLCAIYEPATLAAFHTQANTGNLSPRAWLTRARVKKLTAQDPNVLSNTNTTEEFERIRQQLRTQQQTFGPAKGKIND